MRRGLSLPDDRWLDSQSSSTWCSPKNERELAATGHSRVGLTTKIHAAVDGLGNPIRFIVTASNISEFSQAIALMEGFEAEYFLSDRGYDSHEIVDYIKHELEAEPVIPPRKNRRVLRHYDKELYKEI